MFLNRVSLKTEAKATKLPETTASSFNLAPTDVWRQIITLSFSRTSCPGEGGRSESSPLDPGKVPGPALLPGLPHPEALWEGALYRTLSIRRSVRGTPGGRHRNGHRAAVGGR